MVREGDFQGYVGEMSRNKSLSIDQRTCVIAGDEEDIVYNVFVLHGQPESLRCVTGVGNHPQDVFEAAGARAPAIRLDPL